MNMILNIDRVLSEIEETSKDAASKNSKSFLENMEIWGVGVKELNSLEFKSDVFENVLIYDANFNDTKFVNCMFINCFFLKCDFSGSSFQNNTLSNSHFLNCNFNYSRFSKNSDALVNIQGSMNSFYGCLMSEAISNTKASFHAIHGNIRSVECTFLRNTFVFSPSYKFQHFVQKNVIEISMCNSSIFLKFSKEPLKKFRSPREQESVLHDLRTKYLDMLSKASGTKSNNKPRITLKFAAFDKDVDIKVAFMQGKGENS